MDIFKELVGWAKAHVKDDANVAEFEELVSKAAPPDDSRQALEYMKAIPSLRSALDAEKNREYDRGFKSYEEKELPEKEKALRESIRKELNPDETPEQKETRLTREENARLKAQIERDSLIASLRPAIKEIGIDPDLAEDYAVFGEKALEKARRLAEWHKKELDAVKEQTSRAAFGNRTPTGGSSSNARPQAEIDSMTPKERSAFFADGGQPLVE